MMEIFMLFVLLVLLILLLTSDNSQKRHLEDIRKELGYIRGSLQKIQKDALLQKTVEEKPTPAPADIPSTPKPNIVTPEPSAKPMVEPIFEVIRPAEIIPEPKQETIKDETPVAPPQIQTSPTQSEQPLQPALSAQPAKPVQPINPLQVKTKVAMDMEKFIGENLINKIGIIILVLGMGYFVKYAIDQQWITAYGRAAIGMLTGGALIGIAHRMRINYRTFSSVLVGGGFAVLYLTIFISFHQYHIIDQNTAFALLILITGFSVALSLAYDKKELAIFSQIGGYLSPFMAATGDGNYIALFSYMLILNAGLIALAYQKRWYILNLLSFIFTVVIFSGWISSVLYQNTPMPYLGAFIFAFLFYLVFFMVNMMNALREKKPLKASEMLLILSDNLFFFISGMAILHNLHEGLFKGLFTVFLGLYNFGWLLYLYRKNQPDKNLIYLLVGLVMSFISLAIPIQLNGHSITLFWSAELVILLWLARKTGISLLRTGHLIILGLIIFSLSMDWGNFYGVYHPAVSLMVILNQAFITGLCVLAALGITLYLTTKEPEGYFIKSFLYVKQYQTILTSLLFLFSYLTGIFELTYQMNRFYAFDDFRQVVYALYNFSFLLTCLIIFTRKKQIVLIKTVYYASAAFLIAYFIFYSQSVIAVRDNCLTLQGMTNLNYLFHYLVLIPIGGLITLFLKNRTELAGENKIVSKIYLWFAIFSIVYIASAELDNLILFTQWQSNADFSRLLTLSHRAGYPILWALIAFILMLQGMHKKNKDYRILSLSVFSLILLKLLLFDVWTMSEGGRVASFIFLGIILLVVSFLYQKLKRLILDEPTIQSDNE